MFHTIGRVVEVTFYEEAFFKQILYQPRSQGFVGLAGPCQTSGNEVDIIFDVSLDLFTQ